MPRRMTIADARNNLPQLIHQVQHGEAVELTRRGKPVAMLVSLEEWQSRGRGWTNFFDAMMEWRRKYDLDHHGIEPEEWLPPRDQSPGREVEL